MNAATHTLKDIDVRFISLVNKGANKKTVIWKSGTAIDEPTLSRSINISKIDDEKQMVYGIVYAPDEVDSQGDTATAAEIEQAAHRFMKSARTTHIDKDHNEQARYGYVAENFIVRKGDEMFSEAGAWAVGIKVEDQETWKLIKSGEYSGISMGGFAERVPVEKSDRIQFSDEERDSLVRPIIEGIITFVKSMTTQNPKDTEMKPEEMKKMFAEAAKGAVEESIAPVTKSVEDLKTASDETAATLKKFEERLDVLEKASNGSNQPDPKKKVGKEDEDLGWFGPIAAAFQN